MLPDGIMQIPNHKRMQMTNMYPLTHWGRDEIDVILQTTFLNAFSFMKMYEFWSKFHWFVPRVQLTIFQDWFRWWLGADQATSHYQNQCWLVLAWQSLIYILWISPGLVHVMDCRMLQANTCIWDVFSGTWKCDCEMTIALWIKKVSPS